MIKLHIGMFSTFIKNTGHYFLFVQRVFKRPENHKIYRQRLFEEMETLGVNSLGIITLLSFFMGAVITIQTASNIDSPLIPDYTVGFTARQSMILEFAPTILSLILAGKVGSVIASEIGTMRVSQQIDALEIMGINPASYLGMPKIMASVLINPFLVLIAMAVGMLGGWIVAVSTGLVTTASYIEGLQFDFKPFHIVYALIKAVVFAFIITSISAYQGYYVNGGALEVGRASTRAVTYSSVAILLSNYIITQLLLI